MYVCIEIVNESLHVIIEHLPEIRRAMVCCAVIRLIKLFTAYRGTRERRRQHIGLTGIVHGLAGVRPCWTRVVVR